MNTVFEKVKDKLSKPDLPKFKVGDVVKIHRRVKEGNKERIQIIEGVIIAHKHGFQPGATITLRRVTLGVAVELVFPIYSPYTEKIVIVKRQKTRKAKLYHLRKSKGKKSKLKENIEATRKIRRDQDTQKKEQAEKKAEKTVEEKAENQPE